MSEADVSPEDDDDVDDAVHGVEESKGPPPEDSVVVARVARKPVPGVPVPGVPAPMPAPMSAELMACLSARVETEMIQFNDPDYKTEFRVVCHMNANTVTVEDCFGNLWRVQRSPNFFDEPPTLWLHDEVVSMVPAMEWMPTITAVKWLLAHVAMMQSSGRECGNNATPGY